MPVQRSGGLPLYRQVASLLQERVQKGLYAAEQPLPSEHDLAEELVVSRETIRRAISLLVSQGLLYRRRGIGTFANPHAEFAGKFERNLADFFGQGHCLHEMGKNPLVHLLEARMKPPPPAIGKRMQLPPGTPAFMVRRLVVDDAEPIWLEERYFRERLPVSEEALATLSMMSLLKERCGIVVHQTELQIEAALATAEEEQLLKVTRPAPVLISIYTMWSDDSVPVGGGRTVYRADKYRFTAMLSRGGTTANEL